MVSQDSRLSGVSTQIMLLGGDGDIYPKIVITSRQREDAHALLRKTYGGRHNGLEKSCPWREDQLGAQVIPDHP